MNVSGTVLGTFLGMPIQQQWHDLAHWEAVLSEIGPLRMIIELGTGNGGFSTYLLLQCLARGEQFVTVDRDLAGATRATIGRAINLQDHCVVGDLWGPAGDHVCGLLRDKKNHPLMLFCDDGRKRDEVATFGPLLMPGDGLAVHDWGTEIGPGDMLSLRGHLVEMAQGAMTKWWKVV